MKYIIITILTLGLLTSCITTPKGKIDEKTENLSTLPFTEGVPIRIDFEKGKEFYYPLIVFWIEDMDGNFIETIYASQSIATGTFRYGVAQGGKWTAGERRRQAALPYWGHRRGIKAPDGLYLPTPQEPLPDAITGATPKSNFQLTTSVKPDLQRFKIFMEINQTWDWNHHWHNNLYPDDEEYKTSCQPALVYMAEVDLTASTKEFELNPIGHSHPSGKTGELFPDLNTLTTALQIAKKVVVKVVGFD
jgi:hypothetical protein